jgi:hypothetical protein
MHPKPTYSPYPQEGNVSNAELKYQEFIKNHVSGIRSRLRKAELKSIEETKRNFMKSFRRPPTPESMKNVIRADGTIDFDTMLSNLKAQRERVPYKLSINGLGGTNKSPMKNLKRPLDLDDIAREDIIRRTLARARKEKIQKTSEYDDIPAISLYSIACAENANRPATQELPVQTPLKPVTATSNYF